MLGSLQNTNEGSPTSGKSTTRTTSGYSAEADDGTSALEYLHSHVPPPLILLDWNMAPMNGAAFMAAVNRDRALSGIPVVLLTADARTEDKARTPGFVGYLKKPIDLDSLFAIVRRYCPAN
jgi:CheY-like chemotaxis protein